jgi:4-hydroxy-2-oxoheptanedioate aldolase
VQAPQNAFKRKLTEGETLLGLWLALADAYAAEVCANSGFDWLLIDAEHAPYDQREILATLQALAAYPVAPVLRVPSDDRVYLKQVLEMGVSNLLVPMVETAEQARNLVAAVHYPPLGKRGVGSGLGRSSRWNSYEDYLATADQGICLVVQVETRAGLANIEQIAAVEGIDGIFVGPADLAASMGYLGQSSHPEVRKAVSDAIASVRRVGKAAGVLCVDEPLARQYMRQGATMIAVGVDTTLLLQAAKGLVRRYLGEEPDAADSATKGAY